MRFLHPVSVVLVLDDLLLDHSLAQLELVDAVDEVLSSDEEAGSFHADALHSFLANLVQLHNFLEAKLLILAEDDEVQDLDV